MQAGKTFRIYHGCQVLYRGKEYTVTSYGDWGVRLFAPLTHISSSRHPNYHQPNIVHEPQARQKTPDESSL